MKILIIEDQDATATSLFGAVTGWDYEAEVCSTADAARARVRQEAFDLVLLDIFLPEGVMGHDLIPEFKALRPDMGIITMTGYNSRELELEVRKHGIVCYLTKPFSLRVLKEVLDHITEKKREGRFRAT